MHFQEGRTESYRAATMLSTEPVKENPQNAAQNKNEKKTGCCCFKKKTKKPR